MTRFNTEIWINNKNVNLNCLDVYITSLHIFNYSLFTHNRNKFRKCNMHFVERFLIWIKFIVFLSTTLREIRLIIIIKGLCVRSARIRAMRDEREKRRAADSDFSLRRRRLSYPGGCLPLQWRCRAEASRGGRQEGSSPCNASRYNMVD